MNSVAMREILERYGRRHRTSGHLLHCTPSKVELSEYLTPASANKVIYDTEALAQAAALAIYHLTGTMLYSHPCTRSKTGHRHLTSRPAKGMGRLRGSRQRNTRA